MKKLPLLSVLLSALIFMSCSAFAEDFPSAGFTTFDVEVLVGCTVYNTEGWGLPLWMDDGVAECNVQHSAAQVNGGGFRYIDLNTGVFTATGMWHYDQTPIGTGSISVTACPGTLTSLGYPEGDFPAESFFDVQLVTLNTPMGTFYNVSPLELVGSANQWSSFHGGDNINWSLLGGGGIYDTFDCLTLNFEQPIPEPSSLLALAAGLVPFGLAFRRTV